MLSPYDQIQSGKPGTVGWKIEYHDTIDSTQNRAAELAAEGIAEGAVVIAETQSAGRGRLGRTWHSPPGMNLYATIVLRPRLAAGQLPCLSLVAGVAAADALSKFAPSLVALKWPNDVWLNQKKAGGIIAQALTDLNSAAPVVLLGIGLNLNLPREAIPDDLRATATSLLVETATKFERAVVAKELFSSLDRRYTQIQEQGFAPIARSWEEFSALTGRVVTVIDGERRETGVVRGIGDDGALILESHGRQLRIMVGDVTIEGAYK